jgi:hypothetical protein
MGDIYGYAFLTVAAAAAHDVHQGIFQARQLSYCRIPYSLANLDDCIHLCSELIWNERREEPLYRRSWALQERILSRKTIAYEKDQIVWHCLEKQVLESGLELWHYPRLLASFNPDLWGFRWPEHVREYSLCKATYEMDKLPALSGLVKTIQSGTGDEYIAGLWKSTIGRDLTWCSIDPYTALRSSQYRAPSWSWAAIDGEVFACPQSPNHRLENCAHLVDYSITPLGLDPFAEIARGWILMRGPFTQFYCAGSPDEHPTTYKLYRTNEAVKGERIGCLHPDVIDPEQDKNGSIYRENSGLFGLLIGKYVEEPSIVLWNGIVLVPVNGEEETYRRVGLLTRCHFDGNDQCWFDRCKERTVKII